MHRSTPPTNPKDVDRSCFTGMAQRQRARLITARSHDRNVLPVFSNSQFSELSRCLHSTLITGVAQRLARGAHNSEVRCSNHLSGISPLLALQKPVVYCYDAKLAFTRCSAEAARVAHNHEVIRSKRIAGIRSARPQQSNCFCVGQLKKKHHTNHRLRRLQLLNIGLSVRTKNKSRLSPPMSNHMSKSCLFAFIYLLFAFRFNVRQLVIPFRRRSAYSAKYL